MSNVPNRAEGVVLYLACGVTFTLSAALCIIYGLTLALGDHIDRWDVVLAGLASAWAVTFTQLATWAFAEAGGK